MADHEEETFETVDAGASTTYPMQAGAIRKGGFICIKGFPCKVADVATSKTGKHGHAKCNFTAIDIFTGKKYEDMAPSTHNMDVPNIAREEFTVMDLLDDEYISLMNEKGDIRDDLKLPFGTEESERIAEQIRKEFKDGKELIVSVLKAMNQEMINSVKTVLI